MRILFLLTLLFHLGGAFAQTFNRQYHWAEEGARPVVLIDSHIVVAGSITRGDENHGLIVKTDLLGNVIDTIEIKNTTIKKLHVLPNKGLVVEGYKQVTAPGSSWTKVAVFLARMQDDSILWENVYQPFTNNNFYHQEMVSCRDGGFLLPGLMTSSIDHNFSCFKTDSAGNQEWFHWWGGSQADELTVAQQLNDGSFLVGGYSESINVYEGRHGQIFDMDLYLARLNTTGAVVWEKTWRNFYTPTYDSWEANALDRAADMIAIDSNLFLIGATVEGGMFRPDDFQHLMFLWVDADGKEIHKTYYRQPGRMSVNISKMIELPDHRFMCFGTYRDSIFVDFRFLDQTNAWIAQFSAEGALLWERKLSAGNSHAYLIDAAMMPDGGFVCSGTVAKGTVSGNNDMWLVRLDSAGCDSAGCPTVYTPVDPQVSVAKAWQVFPNPARDQATLLPPASFAGQATVTLCTLAGQRLQTWAVTTTEALTTDNLPDGIYLLNIAVEGAAPETLKLVVTH